MGVPEGTVASAQMGVRQSAGMLVVEGLTQLNVDGRVLPRVAERWQWEQDGLRLRVFLRPNVRFHNGKALTAPLAADVLRTVAASPRNRGLYSSLADIRSIESSGELEVVINLSKRSAFLPEDLSVPLGLENGSIGTGPYRIVKAERSGYVLDAFNDYYLGRPQIQHVIIRPYDGLRTTWTSLLRSEVDMVTDVPPDSAEFLKSGDIQSISFPRWYQFIVAFNSSTPPFTSPAVRRALNLAVDRKTLINRTLKGYGTAATGPVWPKFWAYTENVAGYSFDPSAAAALLDAAGYSVGAAHTASGFPSARLRFTCLIPANFSVLERIALELQREMYDVGIDMQFDVVPIADYDARIRDGKFQAVLVDMISGPSMGRPYIFWRSSKAYKGIYNAFGYEDPEAERLFDIMKTSTNEAAVRSATARLQRVMLDDPPALFLAWSERARVVRRGFHVVQDPGRDPISSLWRWTRASPQQLQAASVQ
jgi:peptide/nickel transport system substrate-binding protein